MKIDKKISCSVTIHDSKNRFIAHHTEGFDSLDRVKTWVKSHYPQYGKLTVTVSQDGGYFEGFFINTWTMIPHYLLFYKSDLYKRPVFITREGRYYTHTFSEAKAWPFTQDEAERYINTAPEYKREKYKVKRAS